MFENHFVINLDKDKDRWLHMQAELPKIGITKPNRFSAIRRKDGRIGCSMSHLMCLKTAQANSWDHVVIFEDDVCFTDAALLVQKIKTIYAAHNFDVLMCAYNAFAPHFDVDADVIHVSKSFCSAMYIVKKHYYTRLIENIKEGIALLKKTGDIVFSLDSFWIKLQQRDLFLAINPPVVTQLSGYSNLLNKKVDYDDVLLNNNKTITKPFFP